MDNQIKGEWQLNWLVPQYKVSKTFLAFCSWLQMPLELANMRNDNLQELHKILNEVLKEFEIKKANFQTQFVGYIDKKEDHLIIGFERNASKEIDAIKVELKK